SLFLTLLGFLSIFYPQPNYGIDFKGGTELQLKFDKSIGAGDVRNTLSKSGYDAEVVTVEGRPGEFLVRVGQASSLSDEQRSKVESALSKSVGGVKVVDSKISPGGDKISLRMADAVDVQAIRSALEETGVKLRDVSAFGSSEQHRYEAQLVGVADELVASLKQSLGDKAPEQPVRVEWVGPKAGQQLRDAAVKSLLWALLFIMAYVAMRFDLRFAPGGVIALIHDALITVLIFVIVRREVNLSTVAALLTILGYSINDTIVIFDRIRENMTRHRDMSMFDLINLSTTQTLSRSLLTSLVTLLSVIPFLIWGTPVIKDFALALVIGMVVGSYSTIYIAGPLTEWMDRKLFSKA
ncbi:MAG TPA: protein translocase subunit SecF, partial [Polyangiales bacterium]